MWLCFVPVVFSDLEPVSLPTPFRFYGFAFLLYFLAPLLCVFVPLRENLSPQRNKASKIFVIR